MRRRVYTNSHVCHLSPVNFKYTENPQTGSVVLKFVHVGHVVDRIYFLRTKPQIRQRHCCSVVIVAHYDNTPMQY